MRLEPIATYRLQLRAESGFDAARERIPYLASLGVSHLYLSPCLQAAAGSTHGYDVVDPTRASEQLGGEEAFRRLCNAAHDAGLAVLLDIVPNHMAIVGAQNPWWWDVLENGPSSRYAIYFDVDWAASQERWPNKVLLPVLGDHYGRLLEKREIALEREGSTFRLRYSDHVLPVDVSSLAPLLSTVAGTTKSEVLEFLAASCRALPRSHSTGNKSVERRHRDIAAIRILLGKLCEEDAAISAAIDAEIERLNRSPEDLDRLIDAQNYRLAFWQIAAHDMGYRRFFDVTTLAGIRVEEPEVFDAVHQRVLQWYRGGLIDGLRIDHPDGLRNPADYFAKLRANFPEAWIVVEKILGRGETLREAWPVDGTTGYDFLAICDALFVDTNAEEAMTQVYADFTGEALDLPKMTLECQRFVLDGLLGGEVDRLTTLLVAICERHWRYRDFSRSELREALIAFVTAFPVYRSYVNPPEPLSSVGRAWIESSFRTASAISPAIDPELLALLRDIMLLEVRGSLEQELVLRLQQLAGATMAKGVEDTLFYRFHRLLSLNEVGNSPARFGASVEEFHAFNAHTSTYWPHTLLASSTHDTKRSEDVRARISVLSQMPDAWEKAVGAWSAHNAAVAERDQVGRNAEYFIYQTLVGIWPVEQERLLEYLQKAMREAKLSTSWTKPDEAYETAVRAFATSLINDEAFTAILEDFLRPVVAQARVCSLAATLLKLTSPGVPDIYQGAELWDLSLVDPDNRRPVDYDWRERLLRELRGKSAEEILARMEEGLPKLHVIVEALRVRRENPGWFGPESSYIPIAVEGNGKVVAFLRSDNCLVIAPVSAAVATTSLRIPEGAWRNRLTGESVPAGLRSLADVLRRFPVALLVRED